MNLEMEAGDLAVIGADDLDTQDYIFEKLRPHTIRKSTRHCTGGEFYFDPDGQYVRCNQAFLGKNPQYCEKLSSWYFFP